MSVKKKAHVNFLTYPYEGRSTHKPENVIMYEWIGEKHACVDLTGVSPLVGLRTEAFTVGQATLKIVLSKMVKHEKSCSDNQHFLYHLFLTLLTLGTRSRKSSSKSSKKSCITTLCLLAS
jgi:hypothetical protein